MKTDSTATKKRDKATQKSPDHGAIRNAAKALASQDGRDWKALKAEERKPYKQRARKENQAGPGA